MTLIELRKSLHEKIDQSNDKELLRQMYFMLELKNKVFIIPEHIKEGIEQGTRDIENGDFITMEEFEKRYEKYLK